MICSLTVPLFNSLTPDALLAATPSSKWTPRYLGGMISLFYPRGDPLGLGKGLWSEKDCVSFTCFHGKREILAPTGPFVGISVNMWRRWDNGFTVIFCAIKKEWFQIVDGKRVLKESQVVETRAFPRIRCVLVTANTQLNIYFVQYLNFNLNCWNSWGHPFKPYIRTPSPHTFISQQ